MKIQANLEYEKGREIGAGRGLNSKVFLVNEPQLGGAMVVKEIEKATFGSASRYFAEAQAVFASAHDNVVPIQYACETASLVCLVMPFYRNGSLSDRLEDGPLPTSEAIRIGVGVCDGLSKIHLAGYVHYDVKPSNVLFSDANVPMVADFGQSRPILPTGLAAVPPLYTLSFPPEVYSAGAGSVLSDVYQTGLLLYRAVNGDDFFQAQVSTHTSLDDAIVLGRFPNRSAFLPHVPKRLRTIIRKAIKVNPVDRYQSAVELSRDLGRVSVLHDWAVVLKPDGTATWTATRASKPSLVVERSRDGIANWKIRMFTEKSGVRRAKDTSSHKAGLSLAQANQYLKDLFESLK